MFSKQRVCPSPPRMAEIHGGTAGKLTGQAYVDFWVS